MSVLAKMLFLAGRERELAESNDLHGTAHYWARQQRRYARDLISKGCQ